MKKTIKILLSISVVLILLVTLFTACSKTESKEKDSATIKSEEKKESEDIIEEKQTIETTTYTISGAYLVDVPNNIEIQKPAEDVSTIKVVGEGWELTLDGTKGTTPIYAKSLAEGWKDKEVADLVETKLVGTFEGYYCFVSDQNTVVIVFDGPEPIVQHCRITLVVAEEGADLNKYVNDAIVSLILGSIRAAEQQENTSSGIDLKTYYLESIKLSAPSDWYEVLNNVLDGVESCRIVSEEDWIDKPEVKIIEITYYREGEDSYSSMQRSLKYFYPSLVENENVTIGDINWLYMSATQDRKNVDIIYNAYFGDIGGRQLLVTFEGIDNSDTIIEQLLSSIKVS